MKKEGKTNYYVCSVSWGKDSTFTLEEVLETGRPLDMVVSVKTGMEFDAVFHVRDKALEKLKRLNIPYVEIDVSEQFLYLMFEHRRKTLDGSEKIGYHWCGGPCRWGTSLKLETLSRYYRENLRQYNVVEYVGIAFDEQERMDLDAVKKGTKLYPMVEDKITEAQALRICYQLGYTWEEDGVYLYEILKRVSCWCCRNKNLKELKELFYKLPKYWERLKQLQSLLPDEPMKGPGKSVFDLEKRFLRQGMQNSMFDVFCFPETVQLNSDCNRGA